MDADGRKVGQIWLFGRFQDVSERVDSQAKDETLGKHILKI